MTYKDQINIVKEQAKKLAEISMLPLNKKLQKDWLEHNMGRSKKPMVIVGDVPWCEMEYENELRCVCENDILRILERDIRRKIYQWKHFRCDMVIEDYYNLFIFIKNQGFGICEESETLSTDVDNPIRSRHFKNQIENFEDIEKIVSTPIYVDEKEFSMLKEIYNDVFSGILEVKYHGANVFHVAWDLLISWRGVEETMMDMIEQPDFIHSIMNKITEVELENITQLEKKNILAKQQDSIIFAPGYYEWQNNTNDINTNALNSWTVGVAQILGNVSKEMHEEFELPYAKRVFERFGNAYYGCCEPLHDRIDMIRKLPNVRKISISPWADPKVAAENIQSDYIMSRKPNPSYIAVDSPDWELIKQDILSTNEACIKNNTPVEYILKDISTVKNNPENLWKWAEKVSGILK